MCKKRITKTQRYLMNKFSELDEKTLREIDVNIKAKIITYQSETINADVSSIIQQEVSTVINKNNKNKFKKDCNKLADVYLQEDYNWTMQENWFCVLAYLIMIGTMILRVINLNACVNDLLTLLIYVFVLALWRVIVANKRMMDSKAHKMLKIFNNNAPSITMIHGMLFYLATLCKNNILLWIIAIILPLLFSIYIIWTWYKRTKTNK